MKKRQIPFTESADRAIVLRARELNCTPEEAAQDLIETGLREAADRRQRIREVEQLSAEGAA